METVIKNNIYKGSLKIIDYISGITWSSQKLVGFFFLLEITTYTNWELVVQVWPRVYN